MQPNPPSTGMAGMVMLDSIDSICNKIDSLLAPYGVRRLSSLEISELKTKKYTHGWRVDTELSYKNENVVLNLLLSKTFPNCLPVVSVARPKIDPLELPHIESDGKLCVWPSRYLVNTKSYEYIVELLRDAVKMLSQAISGNLNSHFFEEFLSYWIFHCDSGLKLTSICNPEDRGSREIYVFNGKESGLTYGDSAGDIVRWLDNRSLLPSKDKVKQRRRAELSIQSSTLVCFREPWLPSEFPKSGGEFLNLINREFHGEEDRIVASIGKSLANQYISTPTVLVSFDTPNGICFVGIVFLRGIFNRQNNKSVIDGFRRTIPLKEFKNRISGIRVTGGMVSRADKSWSIGRDTNRNLKKLDSAIVAIIGCGSVGAMVSKLLAQTGVSNFLLCDGDHIKAENISRHLLGYRNVGQNKALSLSDTLKKDFPFLTVEVYDRDWREYSDFGPFEKADVILSFTGDWYSDQHLLDLQSEKILGPIVFGFVEAQAMAAHVIVNTCDSYAFNSAHHTNGEHVGKMIIPVTYWEHETLVRIPACAGEFQPYGVIPLTHLHAMVAEAITFLLLTEDENDIRPFWKVWFDSRKKLVELGGEWSKEWCDKYFDPGEGNFEVTMELNGGEWVVSDA